MKAKLIFSLPKDQVDFKLANDAGKMYLVLWEYNQWLRQTIKYAPDDLTDEQLAVYAECESQLLNMINENNVNLDI